MPAEAEPPDADPRITFLGPQRTPRVPHVVRHLGLRGRRFGMITAGWRDRETDDALLSDLLGGNTVNLGLWGLMQQVWEADPELAAADHRRRTVHTEMQELYLIGLEQANEAARRIRLHEPRDPRVVKESLMDVVDIMRTLDQRHVSRVDELNADFYERYQPQHRDAVVAGRFRVGRAVADCEAIAITGGHVGVLMGAMHVFNLGPALASPAVPDPLEDAGLRGATDPDDLPPPRLLRPVLAWGAGAMALTERIVLFYDHAVTSPGVSEVLMGGLGLTRGVVALPSPRERLDMRDRRRLGVLARRALPRRGVLLDQRTTVTLTADGRLPDDARVLGSDGIVTTYRQSLLDEAPTEPPLAVGPTGAGGEEVR
ncbi:hypothetical protein [Ornithinimicrobium avium]|uniref:Uncharacterized protein n=1 Tax=Ornithinimicrobium avium TaxID=2283195 RepID=A0A345NP40_9MICO|nr:hypothetical protein [Ornithinimicrobium avium]AXH96798.1 hypothetical protein DV701_12335 [Ornithinimicrobium avium]